MPLRLHDYRSGHQSDGRDFRYQGVGLSWPAFGPNCPWGKRQCDRKGSLGKAGRQTGGGTLA